MNNALHSLQPIERAIAILAAIGATAAIGLAAVEPAVTSTGSRTPSADASVGREARIAVPAVPPAAAGPLDSGLDPWLQQINHGGAHHG